MQQYQKLIYTVCLQFVHEPHTAEDLTQDTFLSAFSAIDRCEPQYYKQWLVRVAANKCKDHLKSAWVRKVDVPGDVHLAHPRAFQVVLAFVGRHADEPLLVILRLAPVYGRKRGEEGILGQILGGVGLVYKLQANRVDELLVLLHQTGKFFICQFPHLLSL